MDATSLRNIVRSKQIVYKVANDVVKSLPKCQLHQKMAIAQTWLKAHLLLTKWSGHPNGHYLIYNKGCQ